ncbi:MAG TPA: hypothetical protein VFQ16_08710 [Burkholderiaceae bacterium]|nr:hypothetical protein [Burkholderiaceae bacterium]
MPRLVDGQQAGAGSLLVALGQFRLRARKRLLLVALDLGEVDDLALLQEEQRHTGRRKDDERRQGEEPHQREALRRHDRRRSHGDDASRWPAAADAPGTGTTNENATRRWRKSLP